jgi:hypothetical protein
MKIKKTVLSTLLLSTAIGTAQAQTAAGKLLLSSQINYNRSKGESNSTSTDPNSPLNSLHQESEQTSFNFSPQIGFFVANNLALGITTSLNSGRLNDTSIREENGNLGASSRNDRTKGVAIGPFVRYYKMLGEKMGFYGQLSGGYQRQTQNYSSNYLGSNGQENYWSETKSTGGYGTLAPGFVFFPTPKIGLELTTGGLSYSRSKSKLVQSSQPYQSNSEGSSSGLGANFGLRYLAIGASFHLGN